MTGMDNIREASYRCSLCGQNRHIHVDIEHHRARVSRSPNGLLSISDIHYCTDGLLSLNNLHVDHNLHVRSFSLMELPDKKRKSISVLGIPEPGIRDISTYRITRMIAEGGYRIVLIDKQLQVKLNIGEVIPEEKPDETITSKKGDVILEYYTSDLPLRKFNRIWFQELVDALESLPPTRLGLFIEALRYVYKHEGQKPDFFGVQQLRTLLTSHKTNFTVLKHNWKAIRTVTNKYGNDKRESIDDMLRLIRNQPGISLREIQIQMRKDLVYLIFLAIILEFEGILEIHRDQDIQG